MTLSWLVCEFCLYGYNMAETIEVNDEIREAQLMEGERPSTDISPPEKSRHGWMRVTTPTPTSPSARH
ncbi:MAG: hypothetical protein SOV34_09470, partial [Sodaliphilus sp.]|nr:hypothetical protein [Sodaliphilus sp.]